ncbi:PIN domain-like protein [Rickenella mellea]|uniref:PIN domain-like protein n=1 Tax=Rickenella mellea TaxID=50990 RepID=A0A4Y7QBI2_9AGAM|nr:PIN domain-like protein [Rickenella mellea]
MGVLGLWDIITLSGQSRSLTHLAVVDGFDSNASSKRAYRVGIDASIWYKHAAFSKGGENPELRLLFFRAVKLAELPLLPLFVFDGRERPKVKRGSKMGKAGSHALTSGMKEILDAFGFEWRMAPGEAEAELAYLNRTGIIDAIMTDDVDAFVFGATTIIRNSSLQLSGNKSNPALDSNGKPSSHHVMVFKASVIATHPGIGLSRGGMVLFALLTGGDYDKGVDKFGKTIAHALARCGFGDQLLRACERRQEESLHLVLPRWRAAVNMELATDSCGFLGRTYPRLQLPDAFPDLKLLENYATPVCSAKLGRQGGGAMRGTGEMNLGRIAAFCEKYFEWGTRTLIVKRFRDLLWEAAVIRILRRAALEADEKEIERRIAAGNMDRHVRGPLRPERRDAVGTPATLVKKYLNISAADLRAQAFANRGPQGNHAQAIPDPHPLIVKIHSSRQHVSTDKIVEYRLEIAPHQLVDLTRSGIIGKRPDEVAKKKKGGTPPDPLSPLRMWCPASMLWQVHPALVEDFEFGAEEKKRKKDERGKGKGKGKNDVNKGKRTYRGSSFGGGSSFSKDVEMVIDLT